MFPKIAVGIITYNRLPLLKQVLASMHLQIVYPKELLSWVLCDDGSTDGTLEWAEQTDYFDVIIRNNRLGMGGNWNSMIEACEARADYTFCNQDDFLYTYPVDLRLAVKFLEHHPVYGMLRYHKSTGHSGLLHIVQEWDTRQAFKNFTFNAQNEYQPHMLPYYELFPAFGDTNTYSPYSGGVHLRHKRFTQCYGTYPTGERFSHSELFFMAKVNQALRTNLNQAQRIVMFHDYLISRFKDIGVSYRDTPVEAETLT